MSTNEPRIELAARAVRDVRRIDAPHAGAFAKRSTSWPPAPRTPMSREDVQE